ncbi:glutamate 5-kinase [Thalassotalea sp. HSM 43]|nr:glutamate 5-kinase [Thalassotalea sp. HSM 43]QBY04317.1 glutamate 5-kinase [Thalassotalea sp. HSM 43]
MKRVVVKVGSALIAPDGKGCNSRHMLPIAQFIREFQQQGIEVVLVSSGAVAAGRIHIAHGSANPSIAAKQAMASVGQSQLMAQWQRFFDGPCSQLLITHGDLKDRARYINIKNTLRLLLENNILPIVNENDTVATQELKVGDNDNLAALVAMVCDADALLILSDVNGVYDADPRSNKEAQLISQIDHIDDAVFAMAGGTRNHLATGGMRTKIEAAQKACEHGIHTYIINGSDSDSFKAFLAAQNPGTHFVANRSLKKAKKHWLKHTLLSQGSVVIDKGAITALLERGASLLASGIKEIYGDFIKGETVNITAHCGTRILAKGIVQYSSNELQRIMGKNSAQIVEILGFCPSVEVIHRDDMVLLVEEVEED